MLVCIKKHEDFNETTRQNDIAIIILNKEATLNDVNKIACLPNRLTYPNVDNQVNAFNWNDLFRNSANTDVRLSLLNSSDCNVNYMFNESSQICAGKLKFTI